MEARRKYPRRSKTPLIIIDSELISSEDENDELPPENEKMILEALQKDEESSTSTEEELMIQHKKNMRAEKDSRIFIVEKISNEEGSFELKEKQFSAPVPMQASKLVYTDICKTLSDGINFHYEFSIREQTEGKQNKLFNYIGDCIDGNYVVKSKTGKIVKANKNIKSNSDFEDVNDEFTHLKIVEKKKIPSLVNRPEYVITKKLSKKKVAK